MHHFQQYQSIWICLCKDSHQSALYFFHVLLFVNLLWFEDLPFTIQDVSDGTISSSCFCLSGNDVISSITYNILFKKHLCVCVCIFFFPLSVQGKANDVCRCAHVESEECLEELVFSFHLGYSRNGIQVLCWAIGSCFNISLALDTLFLINGAFSSVI